MDGFPCFILKLVNIILIIGNLLMLTASLMDRFLILLRKINFCSQKETINIVTKRNDIKNEGNLRKK